VRNEGYSLLYQLLSQESDAAKILILKHADLPIADIIKEGDCRPLGRLRDGGRSCESASSFEDSQSRPITIFAKCNQTRPGRASARGMRADARLRDDRGNANEWEPVLVRLLLPVELQRTNVEPHHVLSGMRLDVAAGSERFSAKDAGDSGMRWGYTP
jgi:hypothetical protein